MKTLKQFLDDTVGKKVDFDGQFGAQCVDLFRRYNADVCGFPHTGSVEGAQDLYLKYDILTKEKSCYNRIGYKAGLVPDAGDVIIWRESGANQYGHVAIVLFACTRNVVVYEQDGLAQHGAKVSVRTYDRCLGWLRRKT